MDIRILHINKHIGKQHILNDICLDIPQGQIVGLLGPNGAGKSTLMKIMAGIWKQDKGDNSIIVPERIGYLPEQNPLYQDMYVREFLATMKRITRASDDIEQLIDLVGLRPEVNKKIRELSKGYKQRVGLAQALMGQPELIILDEPTTGLDPNQLVEIRQLIKGLTMHNTGCTVILSTHILQEVKEMCNRVVIIDRGHIKADRMLNEIEDLEALFHQLTMPQ
ncbi:MAG: ATP-binding cassette domain-containing protein [Bacteroidales bacterium]|nr:ATP-binding cassette domain-containing protein [Candidatus Colicola equi]